MTRPSRPAELLSTLALSMPGLPKSSVDVLLMMHVVATVICTVKVEGAVC